MVEGIIQGFIQMMSIRSVLWMIFGLGWGIIGGALPGVTSAVAMALLLPMTWTMDVHMALATLAGVWVGAAYGGGIPAILINTPGTPGAAATCFDGYILHQQGKTGKAMGVSLVCGTVGGLISVITLLMVVPLSAVTVAFGQAEYFSLAMFGLTIISSLSGDNMLKGLMSGFFGLLLASAGTDTFSSVIRFGMGRIEMIEGLSLAAVMIGMFAVAEMLNIASSMTKESAKIVKVASMTMPTIKEFISTTRATIIGVVIGVIVGVMPGAGQTVSAFVAYAEAKRWSKHPEMFGKGSLEGVAAAETANNCCQGGDMVPALALGIPGSGSAAIMLTALMLHGLVPGPMLFKRSPEITYNLFAAMIIVNSLMLPVGYLAIRICVRAVKVRPPIMVVGVLTLVAIGTFSIRNNIFDVGVAIFFGVIGFLMNRLGFSVPSAVLGLVLGRLLEVSFRRALTLSDGDWMIFLRKPISATFIFLSVMVLFYPLIGQKLIKRKNRRDSAALKS